MARLRRIVTALLAIAALAGLGLLGFAVLRDNPEDLPWKKASPGSKGRRGDST